MGRNGLRGWAKARHKVQLAISSPEHANKLRAKYTLEGTGKGRNWLKAVVVVNKTLYANLPEVGEMLAMVLIKRNRNARPAGGGSESLRSASVEKASKWRRRHLNSLVPFEYRLKDVCC